MDAYAYSIPVTAPPNPSVLRRRFPASELSRPSDSMDGGWPHFCWPANLLKEEKISRLLPPGHSEAYAGRQDDEDGRLFLLSGATVMWI